MIIRSRNGLIATLSEYEYRTHGISDRPVAKVYLIDYEATATDEEIEFSFSFEE
jgi:hypothetical protein